MKTSEVLISARQLITKPENWTQGISVTWSLKHQCWQYCAAGAINYVIDPNFLNPFENLLARNARLALKKALVRRGNVASTIPSFNDSHRHEDVLSLFDAAIATTTAAGD